MIRLTSHAFQRIQQMTVGIEEIVAAVECPTCRYPSPPHHGPGRTISVQGRLAVVHTDGAPTTVITVLWDGESGR